MIQCKEGNTGSTLQPPFPGKCNATLMSNPGSATTFSNSFPPILFQHVVIVHWHQILVQFDFQLNSPRHLRLMTLDLLQICVISIRHSSE